MIFMKMCANRLSSVFLTALKKVAIYISHVTQITQITLKLVNNTLLVHEWWLSFTSLDVCIDFSGEYQSKFWTDLTVQVPKMPSDYISDFWSFKKGSTIRTWPVVVVKDWITNGLLLSATKQIFQMHTWRSYSISLQGLQQLNVSFSGWLPSILQSLWKTLVWQIFNRVRAGRFSITHFADLENKYLLKKVVKELHETVVNIKWYAVKCSIYFLISFWCQFLIFTLFYVS